MEEELQISNEPQNIFSFVNSKCAYENDKILIFAYQIGKLLLKLFFSFSKNKIKWLHILLRVQTAFIFLENNFALCT